MKKIINQTIFITAIVLILSPFCLALAADPAPASMNLLPNVQNAATGAEYGPVTENTIPQMIGQVVRVMLSFVGAIFFILIIVSGIQWMTAGGNEDKVTKSRTRLINASIGLAITVGAYFITWFISTTLISG